MENSSARAGVFGRAFFDVRGGPDPNSLHDAYIQDESWRDLFESIADALSRLALEGQDFADTADPIAAQQIGFVRRRSADVLADIRAAHEAIDRAKIEQDGLFARLKRLVQRFEAKSGIYADLRLPRHGPELSLDEACAIYAVADEALEGLALRSRATGIVLELTFVTGEWRFTFRDDGVGLTARQAIGWRASPHASIRNIACICESLGGKLELKTNVRPRGLLLRANVPLELASDPMSTGFRAGFEPAQNE